MNTTVGNNNVSDDLFKSRLIAEGKTILRQKPDGNCGFRALGIALEKPYKKVRRQVAAYLERHRHRYKIAKIDIAKTKCDKAWIGWQALVAASKRYRINIIVHIPSGSELKTVNHARYDKTVQLSFHSNEHYNRLIDREELACFDTLPEYLQKYMCERDDDVNEDNDDGNDTDFESSDEDEEMEDFIDDYPPDDQFKWPVNHFLSSNSISMEADSDPLQLEFKHAPNVFDTKMLRFLCQKFFSAGRMAINIDVLVPKSINTKNFARACELAQGHVFYVYFNNQQSNLELLTDENLMDEYNLFETKLYMPEIFICRYQWLAHTILTHLILCALNHKYSGANFMLMAKFKGNSLIMDILDRLWPESKNNVLNTVRNYLATGTGPFCLCAHRGDKCMTYDHFTHLDVKKFHPIATEEVEFVNGYSFFKRAKIFQRRLLELPNTLSKLAAVVNDHRDVEAKLLQCISILDENADTHKDDLYTAYLFMGVDGPNMQSFKDQDVADKTAIRDCKIVIYSGSGTGFVGVRSGHFTHEEKSGIYPVLTKTMKCFELYSIQFQTLRQAKEYEALVTETLKYYIYRRSLEFGRLPFLLLNNISMRVQLLKYGVSEMLSAVHFAESGSPVFTHDEKESVPATSTTFFEGKCFMKHFNPPKGPYSNKTFESVSQVYLDLEKRHWDQNQN